MNVQVHKATIPRPQTHASSLRLLEVSAWLFLLVAVGRVGELVPGLSGLPLAKVALGLAIIVFAMSWKSLPRVSPSRIPLLKTCVTLGMLAVLSVPFSVWPGASLEFVTQQLPVLIVSVILIYRLAYSWPSLKRVFLAFVAAGSILAFDTLLGFSGGRASTDATMYDTNDLAYALVTIFPIALAFAFTTRQRGKRILFMGAVFAFVAAILLTSSRGGFLGLLAASGIIALNTGTLSADAKRPSGGFGKALLGLFMCLFLAAAIWPMLPTEHQERLSSLLNIESDYNLDPDNEKGRRQIWERGLDALTDRPQGHGVGAYGMVDFRYGGKMLAPHSSLVQISVELGVLGGILFLFLYVHAYGALGRARKAWIATGHMNETQMEQSVFFRMVQASLFGNFVSGLFLSMAYTGLFWIIVALAMGCMALAPASSAGRAASRAR